MPQTDVSDQPVMPPQGMYIPGTSVGQDQDDPYRYKNPDDADDELEYMH